MISQTDALTNLAMCGVPIVLGFVALFLPYFSVSSDSFGTQSISWSEGGSDGPFIFALLFLIVATIPLALQFLPRINPKQLLSSSGLVTAAGIVLAINIARNFSPNDLDGSTANLELYGITVSRGIGFWLLVAASVLLIGTGIFFSARIKQAANNANRAPGAFGAPYGGPGFPTPGGQPFPGQVGGQQPPFPAPGQQLPAQQWGNQPGQFGQQPTQGNQPGQFGQQPLGGQPAQGFPGPSENDARPDSSGPLTQP